MKMSKTVTTIMAVLVCSSGLVLSRIHQTADSIIFEVEAKAAGRKERYPNSAGKSWLPFLLPALDPNAIKKAMKFKSPLLPASTYLITEKSNECWMPDGNYGVCGPALSCNNPPSGMLPSRNTCRYVSNGKEDTGVCCPMAPSHFDGMIAWLYHPFLHPISLHNVGTASLSTTWPWWEPMTASTTASSPTITSTTASPPITTSPWWVPDISSTIDTPSITTSPWWVPDNSTTTSPWWVPESPSTTALPSPTSTWWVAESSSTTTSLSSTTSPWWVAETSTTTSRPSTTSPWWIPDASSTMTLSSTTTSLSLPTGTSPTTTTSSSTTTPSTTSLSLVTETSTTSTSRPSTTSPWWTPDASSTLKLPTVTSPHPAMEFTTVAITPASQSSGGSCGKGPYKLLEWPRIIGGMTSVKNAWPFAVSMMAKGRHFCGGSLVDEQHILTAAHCVATFSTYDIAGVEVILGLHTLKPMDPQVVRRKLIRVVRHKGYNAATFFNDIAILKMDSPVTFSDTISPVCLPSRNTTDLYVNKAAIVVGWGALQEDGKLLPTSLQQVTVQVQTNAQCQINYGSDAPGGIQDNMLCAANPNKDSCMGDSGGPLVVQESPGSPWIQAGIVSWGIGCGRDTYPGVYVRTTSFIDWIKKNLD